MTNEMMKKICSKFSKHLEAGNIEGAKALAELLEDDPIYCCVEIALNNKINELKAKVA